MAFASIAKYIQPPYVRSPLNYTGGKYKLLNRIIPMLPKSIDTFVDMFAGGLNVGANVKCNHLIANDICKPIIELYEYFKQTPLETILAGINEIRSKYNLSRSISDGYYRLRDDYNMRPSPLSLFLLCRLSFNYQIRFNSNGKFNMPKGLDNQVKMLNDGIYEALSSFLDAIKSKVTTFVSMDFRNLLDSLPTITPQNGGGGILLYADPPYLITEATYNAGWTESDDTDLMKYLDKMDAQGYKFMTSNVLQHRGRTNNHLVEWSKKYKVTQLAMDYSNCNYHAKNSNEPTVEVVITNY